MKKRQADNTRLSLFHFAKKNVKYFRKFAKMVLALLVVLLIWISWDLFNHSKSDFRKFDPQQIGQLETSMWKAYYEKKPFLLFFSLSKTLRIQFKAPFWKSQLLAFYASKAAVTFQKGKDRKDYIKALPYLEKYFAGINNLSEKAFDIKSVASNELEWWIIRRKPELHDPGEWELLIVQIAAEIYQLPQEKMHQHAKIRVQAMIKRDNLGEKISENDWTEIEQLLIKCWRVLHKEVNEG